MERIDSDARCVFLSDIHLGWRFSKPTLLHRLLIDWRPERLYLVGDTFEWFNRTVSDAERVVRQFVDAVKQLEADGTRVVVLPGNHDSRLADLSAHTGWEVQPFVVHETLRGQRLLVTHGDVFDLNDGNLRSPWKRLGSWIYPEFVRLGDALHRHGLCDVDHEEHWCTRWKLRSRQARQHIAEFEAFMVDLAEHHGCDGVVCGHIHRPDAKPVGERWYFNCGDWIEHRSLIYEDRMGRINLSKHAIRNSEKSTAA